MSVSEARSRETTTERPSLPGGGATSWWAIRSERLLNPRKIQVPRQLRLCEHGHRQRLGLARTVVSMTRFQPRDLDRGEVFLETTGVDLARTGQVVDPASGAVRDEALDHILIAAEGR